MVTNRWHEFLCLYFFRFLYYFLFVCFFFSMTYIFIVSPNEINEFSFFSLVVIFSFVVIDLISVEPNEVLKKLCCVFRHFLDFHRRQQLFVLITCFPLIYLTFKISISFYIPKSFRNLHLHKIHTWFVFLRISIGTILNAYHCFMKYIIYFIRWLETGLMNTIPELCGFCSWKQLSSNELHLLNFKWHSIFLHLIQMHTY